MPQAARSADSIGHSPSMSWLLAGLLTGAAIAAAGVAIVGTGGLAAVALVGGAAALGGGLGETLSTMSWAPKEVCGTISGSCSLNVFTNGRPAARASADLTKCDKHSGARLPIAMGSANVFINGMSAARVGDKIVCGAVISSGSNNVFIGGGSEQTDRINSEDLVPDWVQGALLAVGLGSAVVLGGWLLAIGGTVGGFGVGAAGAWAGGKLFGQGSDGQKWSALAAAILGSILGAKGAPSALRLVSTRPRPQLLAEPVQTGGTKLSSEIEGLRRIAANNNSPAGAVFNARISLKPYVVARDVEGLIGQLDVTTGGRPKGFWSGNLDAAKGQADQYGVALLETTPGGKVVNDWKFLNKTLPWETGGQDFWTGISSKYASGAEGEIYVWQSPDRAYAADGTLDWKGGYVWQNFEKPIIQDLSDQGVVTEIQYGLVEPTTPNAPLRWH